MPTPLHLTRRSTAAIACTPLALSPIPMHAADLNAEVNNMFTNLGACESTRYLILAKTTIILVQPVNSIVKTARFF